MVEQKHATLFTFCTGYAQGESGMAQLCDISSCQWEPWLLALQGGRASKRTKVWLKHAKNAKEEEENFIDVVNETKNYRGKSFILFCSLQV
jgi:hypothetical protein